MFQDNDLLTLVNGNSIVRIDEDKHIFCARGQQLDIFFYDEGNGSSHILATQPASPDGQPTSEIKNLLSSLSKLVDMYFQDGE